MADTPRKFPPFNRNSVELDDLEQVRAAARAAYRGKAIPLSDAVKQRDRQRAERERDAAKSYYLGTPRNIR